MILYFSGLALTLICTYFAERRNRLKVYIFGAILLGLLSGCRDISVGTDTKVYSYYFNLMLNGKSESFEIGFRYVSQALLNIFGNEHAVFIFFALLINILIFIRIWTYRDKASLTVMTAIYIFILFPQSMNILRQFVALSIVFCFSYFIEKKKYLIFIIAVLMATLFHTSALLGLLLLGVYYCFGDNSSTKKIAFVGSAMVVAFIGYAYIMTVLGRYLEHFVSQNVRGFGYFTYIRFIPILLMIGLLISRKYYFQDIEKDSIILKVATFNYLLGVFMSIIGVFYDQMDRIALYYMIFEIPFVGMACRNNRYRQIYGLFYFLLSMFFLVLKLCIQSENGIIPFSLFF